MDQFDDLQRLRNVNAASRPIGPGMTPGTWPAFVGKVTGPSTILVGRFVGVQPMVVTGAEVEGGAGTVTQSGAPATVAVLLLGPAVASIGDMLICRYVDSRWVTERMSGAGKPTLYVASTSTVAFVGGSSGGSVLTVASASAVSWVGGHVDSEGGGGGPGGS
jgi:hypothetical protein